MSTIDPFPILIAATVAMLVVLALVACIVIALGLIATHFADEDALEQQPGWSGCIEAELMREDSAEVTP